MVPRPREQPSAGTVRVLVTVTFNDNQLRSHLLPIIALDEVESLHLVADVPPAPLPKVTVTVPPRWLSRIVGRAGAKLITCVLLARRTRPDWVIGFNLVPHGLNAIAAARIAGSRSIYEMIGGDREWIGGGWISDNGFLSRLRSPNRLLERALLGAARRATLVVTMGEVGRGVLVGRGFAPKRVIAIPPSVESDRFTPRAGVPKTYDVVTVAALIGRKRIADLIEAVAMLVPTHPALRVALIGEGPLEADLRRLARDLGVAENVEFLGFRSDVEAFYEDARLFVLPSEYEGLSVAMLEAMTCGAVPVVADVGELGGEIRAGRTGVAYPAGDVDALAGALRDLLDDSERLEELSEAAARRARAVASVEVVSATYRRLLVAPPDA